MAIPALKIEPEAPLEERVARLEINVEHIQKDVSDMKVDIRRLGDKIDSVDQKLTAKIDDVEKAHAKSTVSSKGSLPKSTVSISASPARSTA